MFRADIYATLEKLGLKKTEIDVYLTCLQQLEGLRIQDIADATKITRSTVNLITDRLLEKGYLTYHTEGARRFFTAQPPEHLLYELENSAQDLRGILPLLLKKTTNGTAKVRFFEGREEVWKIYSDSLLTLTMDKDPQRELLAISSGKDVFKVMPHHQESFINKRIKEGIPIRWIAPDVDYSRRFLETNEQSLRQMKFFDGQAYPFEMEIDIYSNKVALTNLSEDHPTGVILENADLAKSMRALFNLLWDSIHQK